MRGLADRISGDPEVEWELPIRQVPFGNGGRPVSAGDQLRWRRQHRGDVNRTGPFDNAGGGTFDSLP